MKKKTAKISFYKTLSPHIVSMVVTGSNLGNDCYCSSIEIMREDLKTMLKLLKQKKYEKGKQLMIKSYRKLKT